MKTAIQSVGAKHSTEEQDLRNQEQPHSEFAGIKLLLWVIEVVSQEWQMPMFSMAVITMGFICSQCRIV